MSWTYGNHLRLYENGEAYYPAVFEAIRAARQEVLLETFIVFDDAIGRGLRDALIEAARNGARVVATADGYGSPLPDAFLAGLAEAGVDFRYFDPRPRLLGLRTNAFRRLHRKLVVIDRTRAFIGGINYSEDHVREFGPEAKQDYAAEIVGPAVDEIHAFMTAALEQRRLPRAMPWWRPRASAPMAQGARAAGAAAAFVWRDNDRHRDDIELHYRAAIRSARRDVLIANAYFFPGYRLLRELRLAAQRGVRVRLMLQGSPDRPIMRWAARTLYEFLIRKGVRIYEYCERPFHGKVAVVDDDWSTIGSSNLDPLSLSLNLEANLMVHDRAFTAELRERLETLIGRHCREVAADEVPRRTLLRQVLSYAVFHFLRRFPAWAGWLPMRPQPVVPIFSDEAAQTDTSQPSHRTG